MAEFTLTFPKSSMGLLSMEAQYRMLALESQGGKDSLQSALTRLPSFFKTVQGKLSQVFKESIDAFWKPKDLQWAADVLMHHNYMDLRERMLPTLPSMRVDYLTYTHALAEDAKLSATILHDYINPLATSVAAFLGQHDRLSQHHPVESLSHYDLKVFEHHLKAFQKLIDVHHGETMRPYGKLIKRQNDWQAILLNVDTIGKAFREADHAAFAYSVERVNDLLGKLLQRMTDEPELYRISGPTLEALTHASYVTATAIEFYGLTYKRAMALEAAMQNMVDAVKAIN